MHMTFYLSMLSWQARPHRAFESTVKENIPPKSIAQGKGTVHEHTFLL